MTSLRYLRNNLALIEKKIAYVFANKELLVLSFVHRSFVNEYRTLMAEHNERLEFLGDSVLGLAVAAFLYHRLPTYPEGRLSQLRSWLVDASSCAKYLQKLELSEFILLGRGELREGKTKLSILSDTFEALVGAIYLDGGFAKAESFLLIHFEEEIEMAIGNPPRNFKAELQDFSQRKYQKPPLYKVVQEAGPDHAKMFHVIVYLDEKEMGIGVGSSKKQAEQRAALEALTKMEQL